MDDVHSPGRGRARRNPDAPAPTRIHHLDALRGVAMLLGVVLHTAAFLVPLDTWPVQDRWATATPPEQNVYALGISAIHGFRMPLFFLVSGFFAAFLWRARGLRGLVRHRLDRVGLPLLAGAFTIVPIVAWQFAGAAFSPMDWPLAWLDGLAHLWFLWYLLLMTAAFSLAIRLGLRFRHRLWWLLAPAVFVPQFLMQERLGFGADTEVGVVPMPRVFVYYLLFFLFGVFVHQRRIDMRRWWTAAVPFALLPVHFAGLMLMHDERFRSADPTSVWAAAAALQVVYAWLMCFGAMGLFLWVASKERFWVRYLSDASYWIYLCHVPLVIAGQQLAVAWAVSVHLKFAAICAVAVASLLAVYQAGVRYTVIGTMLNGPRTRRGAAARPFRARGSVLNAAD